MQQATQNSHSFWAINETTKAAAFILTAPFEVDCKIILRNFDLFFMFMEFQKTAGGHSDITGSIAASHLQDPGFNPELSLWALWIFVCFLSGKKMLVGGLPTLNSVKTERVYEYVRVCLVS